MLYGKSRRFESISVDRSRGDGQFIPSPEKITFLINSDKYIGEDVDTARKLPYELTLDIKKGRIEDWKYGRFHASYKMVDAFSCYIECEGGTDFEVSGEYVPNMLSVYTPGWGDYISMYIDPDGRVEDFNSKEAADSLRRYIFNLLRENKQHWYSLRSEHHIKCSGFSLDKIYILTNI